VESLQKNYWTDKTDTTIPGYRSTHDKGGKCTFTTCSVFNVENRCLRQGCCQPLEKHSNVEHAICRARPFKKDTPPLELFCSQGRCEEKFKNSALTIRCTPSEWERLHVHQNQPSPQKAHHPMEAAAYRADVGKEVEYISSLNCEVSFLCLSRLVRGPTTRQSGKT